MNIFAFDTEDNSKGKAFLFNFYNVKHDKHYTFTSQLDALDFVCSLHGITLWAVNLEYDINNLFRNYYALLKYTFAGSRLICAEFADQSGKNKTKFYDTMNHWKLSVKEMGKRINLPKLEMKHTGATRATNKMIEYCKRDTEITGKFVKTMLDVYDKIGCEPKMTIASTSLHHFETNYYKKLSHTFTNEQIDFFHEGYYGGRTEIFYTKPIEGKIWYHDINSLYPYCLKMFQYPDLSRYSETLHCDFEGRSGMADIEIEAPLDLEIPYLPARYNKKLVFPIGRWRGVYTYFEIRTAISLGYKVHEIFRAIEFEGTYNPFSDYIDDLYSKRLEAKAQKDELMSNAFKDLMNHCYGKFAQGNEFTKMIPLDKHDLKPGDTIFFDLVLTTEQEDYPRYANCIWACYATAYARTELYTRLITVNHAKGATLLYCDTDSIVYEAPNSIFNASSDLGGLKLEGIFDYAYFKLPKLYALRNARETSYKAKGVPFKAREEYFKNGKAQFQKPNRLRETLRRNLSPKNKIKLIPNYWEMREKNINQMYDKRISNGQGFTRPIQIEI